MNFRDIDLQSAAKALGGKVRTGQVLAPGPGRSPSDRSLSIKIDTEAPDGFIVHSFANADPIRCKDYVRSKLSSLKPNGVNGNEHAASAATVNSAPTQIEQWQIELAREASEGRGIDALHKILSTIKKE